MHIHTGTPSVAITRTEITTTGSVHTYIEERTNMHIHTGTPSVAITRTEITARLLLYRDCHNSIEPRGPCVISRKAAAER